MCGKRMSFEENEKGFRCDSVLIYEKLEIAKEFYFRIGYRKSDAKLILEYSKRGGLEYE